MPIVPDDKSWTWVLERPCPECGFDASTFPADDVAGLLRSNAAAWVEVLGRPDVELRQRPDDSTWSPLEYACHVRDVFVLYDQRLALLRAEDDPEFPNWDQDETAVAERYDQQDPVAVAARLLRAGIRLADAFDSLGPDEWRRTGRRSDGAEFTVDTFARYLVHDPVHHLLYDVGQGGAA